MHPDRCFHGADRARSRALDEQGLRAQLETLIAKSESRVAGEDTWAFAEAPAADVDAMIREIIAFELPARTWRPTFKLSQNKSAAQRRQVAAHLQATDARDMAQLMRAAVPA
jgi:transcriptional regulator